MNFLCDKNATSVKKSLTAVRQARKSGLSAFQLKLMRYGLQKVQKYIYKYLTLHCTILAII